MRHHRAKKNQTDGVKSVPNIDYRYIVAFIYPITATMKPFLAKKGHSTADVEKMYQAWFKAVGPIGRFVECTLYQRGVTSKKAKHPQIRQRIKNTLFVSEDAQ